LKTKTKGVEAIAEKEEAYHLDPDYKSHAVKIGCGDYRPDGLVDKYLKRKHQILHADNASTASGSRTISLFGVKEEELKLFEIKQAALFIDIDKYIHHGATTCVIACHSLCAFWPTFSNAEEEFKAHYLSLLMAGGIIKEKYPQFKEIILLYIVLDKKKPHRPVEVIEIDLEGDYKVTDLKLDREMAPRPRHV
jgi:hypothetical protein